MIDTNECFEKGLLKKDFPSLDLAKKSLKQAEFFLKEAYDMIELSKKELAIISLYNGFFHVARAMLFKDGIKERSHFCVARYIESEYVKKKLLEAEFLNAFETLMGLRKNIQYSTERTLIDEDLTEFYNICEKFIAVIEGMIK